MRSIEGLRGAAVVTRAGSVELEAAGGPSGQKAGSVCTTRTRFQISSISKQFTATSVLLLAEQGALGLDDPIDRWFADCPADWRAITIHHLLTHTSGVGHWSDIPDFDVFRPMDFDERLARFQRAPLRAAPGGEWNYSGPGYVLLGQIAQQASGRPYATFLTEHVFAPLGLASTSADGVPTGSDVAHGRHDGQPLQSGDVPPMVGTSDVWSTVGDLARFTTAISSGSLLSDASRRARLTVHTSLGDQPTTDDAWMTDDGYGYGVFIGKIAEHTVHYHPGDVPGYVSFNAWLPEHDACIAVLTNDDTSSVAHLLRQLLPSAVDR